MELLAGFLVCVAVLVAIALLLQVLFCLTLYRTQSAVAEPNRELAPGLVWLEMIPLFNLVWGVIMVPRLSSSLRREFEDRGWRTEGEQFGLGVGMIWAWGNVANAVIGVIEVIVELAGLEGVSLALSLTTLPIGVALLVLWIVYWVQMAQYGRRLREGQPAYAPGSLEEDYDDQYTGPARRRAVDDSDRPRRRMDDGLDEGDRRPRDRGDR
jgi:hypothetical protein